MAVLIDLYSRKIVGYALEDHMRTALPLKALEMAFSRRNPAPGLLHPSDRGSQYAALDYRRALEARGATASMSRSGNCYDNAVVESFNDKIKQELLERGPLRSPDEIRRLIVDYIEMFYNPQRLHSTLGYRSPNDFEQKYGNRAFAS